MKDNETLYFENALPFASMAIRDDSPLSEWIATGFDITVFSATERIPSEAP